MLLSIFLRTFRIGEVLDFVHHSPTVLTMIRITFVKALTFSLIALVAIAIGLRIKYRQSQQSRNLARLEGKTLYELRVISTEIERLLSESDRSIVTNTAGAIDLNQVFILSSNKNSLISAADFLPEHWTNGFSDPWGRPYRAWITTNGVIKIWVEGDSFQTRSVSNLLFQRDFHQDSSVP